MVTLKIGGFKTKAEVEAFIGWYEGQGEQDACIWFECRKSMGLIDVDSMNMDMYFGIKWAGDEATIMVKPL